MYEHEERGKYYKYYVQVSKIMLWHMDVTWIRICQNENLYQGPYKMIWIRNTAGIFLAVCGLASELPALHGRFVISYYFRESCVSNFMVLSLLVIHTPLTHTHNHILQTQTITHHWHTQSSTSDTHNHTSWTYTITHPRHTQPRTSLTRKITHPTHNHTPQTQTITHPTHNHTPQTQTITHTTHTHNHTPQTHLQ